MKYIKGKNNIIEASEKAYNLIYKEQGFKPYKEPEEVIETEEGEENGTEGNS
ncbi:TPA: hypothetical protein I9080_003129 [Clostridium perfringens]|uniref:Uncharacterized protein n=1 Tax=Clostridium perfringens TaxID=1502 RepID=A0A8H9R1W0_CLOPF|nr:hypothetical protein [Clostridium perfringens]